MQLGVVEHVLVRARLQARLPQRFPLQHLFRQFRRGPAVLPQVDEPPPHDAVPEIELPAAVDGDPACRRNAPQRLDAGNPFPVGARDEGGEVDDRGVAGELCHLPGQLVDPLPLAEGKIDRGEGRRGLPEVGAVELAGDGVVVDDDDLPGGGVQFQDQAHRIREAGALVDAGEVRSFLDTLGVEVVGAAEHHRYRAEDLVPVPFQDVEGVVVAGDDEVEGAVAVLETERVEYPAVEFRADVVLRVEVLHRDFRCRKALAQPLVEAGDDAVGTLVARVVGVEKQDLPGLHLLAVERRREGEGGQNQKAKKEVTEHHHVHTYPAVCLCEADLPVD